MEGPLALFWRRTFRHDGNGLGRRQALIVDLSTRPGLLVVSTYPPTLCGIANFSHSLVAAIWRIRGERDSVGVVRLVPPGDDSVCLDPEIAAESTPGSVNWLEVLTHCAPSHDLLWIQHEFGIFGPDDGRSVLDLCEAAPLPIATTLHTVPGRPTAGQRRILEELVAKSDAVVVMSQAARARLLGGRNVNESKVHVIPHGAHAFSRDMEVAHSGRRPTIVTWGLVGPGKGIEWGIQAMALLRHLDPLPRLVIRGATHPNVKRREGESYREQLDGLIRKLGVDDMVQMEGEYLSTADLGSLISQADLALLSYDTIEQVTSGVLIEAVGAGLPVVASAFPHAIEMLADGAGLVVPHRDPQAIARVLERYLTHPSELKAASLVASRVRQRMSWPNVALAYEKLAGRILADRMSSVA